MRMLADVGVGTIRTESEARRALDCGAHYLVTPTMNLSVVKLAVERQMRLPRRTDADRACCRLGRARPRSRSSPPKPWRRLPQASPWPVP